MPTVPAPSATAEAGRRLLEAVRERRIGDAVKALSLVPPEVAGPEAAAAAAWALLARALQSYSSGAPVNSAIADLSLATRYLPSHGLLWFHLGLAFLKAGLDKKALWALRKAVELEPANPRYLYHAAWAAVAADSAEAPGWLARLDTSRPETRFLRTAREILLGGDAAVPDAGAPGSERASMLFLQGIARCLRAWCGGTSPGQAPSAGRITEAIARFDWRPGADCFERAARLEPHNAVVRLVAGNMELERGQSSAAWDHMRAAAEGGLNLPELAECLRRLGVHVTVRKLAEEGEAGAPPLTENAGAGTAEADALRRAQDAVRAARALASAREGNFPQAVLLWKQIEGRAGSELAVLHNLALAYERLGDAEKAAAYWRRWNRRRLGRQSGACNPAFEAKVHARLARSFMEAGLAEDAARAFETVLRFAPGDLETREALATLCEEAERWDEALVHLDYLLKQRPDSSTLLTRAGLARMMSGDLEGATEAWSRAVKLEPLNRAAQKYLVEALRARLARMNALEYRRAGLRLIQDVVDRLPGQYGPELVLSGYLYSLGEHKKGKEVMQRALSLGAEIPEAWIEAFRILHVFGRERELRRLADRLLQEHGESAELLGPAGQFMARKGYLDHAARLFQAAMRHSQSELVPRNIARAYLAAGYPEEACAWAEKALERAPKDAETHFILALARYQQGDTERAEQAMSAARMLAQASGDRDLLEWIREVEQPTRLPSFLWDLLGG